MSTKMETDFQGKPDLAAIDNPFEKEDKMSSSKTRGFDGGSNVEHKIDGCNYPRCRIGN